jgi:phosphate transport system substrate-binding protein
MRAPGTAMRSTAGPIVLAILAGAACFAQARVVTDTPPEWRVKSPRPSVEPIRLDPKLPDYRPVGGLAGTVRSVGSSGLSNLMHTWVDEFQGIYPKVQVEIEGVGSEGGVAALVQGTADIAPMSRAMSPAEIAQFQARYGYAPTRIPVALDAIAVYVNKYNPLQSIDMEQLAAIYAARRKSGGEPIRTWGQVGLGGEWAARAIAVKSPDKKQGLYAMFRDLVLEGGDYRYDLQPEPVSTSIVQAVGAEADAIGFASRFYATLRTRALAVRPRAGGTPVPLTAENCQNGSYPLARKLYLYINRKPGTAVPAAVEQLVTFACSRAGQETVAKEGNLPLSAALARDECIAPLH